jgi:subtilisin-like proprotein convertase family protein
MNSSTNYQYIPSWNKLFLLVTFFILALIPQQVDAQLTVNNGFTAQQLGNNLAGSNVTVTNASISGTGLQSGVFQYTGNDLGLNSGVILSTGDIFDAVGPNSNGGTSTGFGGPGDVDLSALAGFNTNDAVVFEFDFEVQGDEIEFNFVFLSEEYNEFVGTGFNDVFAFYISGPGIIGQENLAVVPSTTTPVTINTINNGSFWQYYNDNTAGGVNIEFDGFTTLMKAQKSGLIPCGIYTLSLRIADGSDDIYDSGVLLEENSLVQTNVSASSNTYSGNNTALEGCIDASFTFELDSIMPTDIDINIGIGGSAINGVDYAHIDTLITIPAGQLSATIIIDAIADGLVEGQEVIELYFQSSPCAPPDTVFLYIDDYQPIEFTSEPTNLSCFESGDGEVDFTITGGIPPYTVTLTDSATGVSTSHTTFPVTGLDAGTYYIAIIDGYGCAAEDIISGAFFDAGQTFIPDGQGGSFTNSLTLSGFAAGQTVSSPTQIQSVCATMEHSRIGELEITLTAPGGTVVILKEQPGGAVTNFGEPCAIGPADGGNGNNDTLPGVGYNYCWTAVNPVFGTMVSEANNYSYSYTNQCDGSTQSDKYLPAGSYLPYESFANFVGSPLNGAWTITVTDAIPNNNGYIFDWSISLEADPPDSIVTLTQPNLPVFSSSTVNPDCGLSNGSIDITLSGGNPPFTFLWNTGATTEDISGIPSGSYSVDVTDDSSCVYTFQVNLSNNGSIVLSGDTTDETCVGINDGTIDLTVTGATAPITFLWSNGATTEDLTNLTPGTYTVEVNDASGCLGVISFTVNPASPITISGSVIDENCGDQEGVIDIVVLGGVLPYTYLWSNGDTTQSTTELAQGEYNVIVTDVNGCTQVDTFTVINLVGNCVPNCDLAITDSLIQDEICGNANGLIDLTIFTSNGPLQINWDNGATTEDIFSLSAGTYEVTLIDNEGCDLIRSYTITNQTGGLTISSINVINENCGNGLGGLDATITGGALPYTFSWSNGATTEDLTGVSAGTYTLTVTDANGCSYADVGVVNNNSGNLTQTYGNAVDEVCGLSNFNQYSCRKLHLHYY